MTDANFYRQLPAFSNFEELANLSYYVCPPKDWCVVISDVRGSTRAIEQGKYKTVNMVGASTIAAISNVLDTMEFPYVFGGDGATALVPAERTQEIEESLRAVQRQAKEAYDLSLRIGIVPVRDLYAQNKSIEVAKFALGGGPTIAFFHGAGVALAEEWVKAGRFQIAPGKEASVHEALKGLSCRWAPVSSTHGCMLSVMIKAVSQEESDQVLSRVYSHVESLIHLSSLDTHPLKSRMFKMENIFLASALEVDLLGQRPRWLARAVVILQMFAVWVMRKLNLGTHGIKIREYLQDNTTHSDFRKFDGMLRFVADCSPESKAKLLEFLEKEKLAGQIFYGVSESDSALLTCFVERLSKGKHIHFIDGNHGGYAMAAKRMKEQAGLAH